jgi:tartrate-resistant acid phosphatase type 5
MATFHSEPYIHLAGLRHDAALVAWGAFYFRTSRWRRRRDETRRGQGPQTRISATEDEHRSIVAKLSQRDRLGEVGGRRFAVDVAVSKEENRNHAWVHGLKPDTNYTYEVRVNGEVWAGGPRRDWVIDKTVRGFRRTAAEYQNRFRTFPDPTATAPDFSFAIIGDYGRWLSQLALPPDPSRTPWAHLVAVICGRAARALLKV